MSLCTVCCYGENDKCVLGLPEAGNYDLTPLLTQPDTGASFIFGIQDDAEQEEQTSFFTPFQIASISTSQTHSLFLTTCGVCYGAGSNGSNRLALGSVDSFVVAEPTRITFFTDLNLRVTKCFAIEYGSLWCTEDGAVYFAGRIYISENNVGANIDVGPVRITKNHPKFSRIAALYYSILFQGGKATKIHLH